MPGPDSRDKKILSKTNSAAFQNMTQCKMEVRILSGGVPKNLTLHGMSKIDFQPDFRNALMLSFLMMYNTMGSKVDGLAVREHFLSKNALKTAILVDTILDHLT